MQTISILNKVELALRRQSSVRDRFEVSGVESRDRGETRRDNLPQRLDIKSPERRDSWNEDKDSRGWMSELSRLFARNGKYFPEGAETCFGCE